GSLEEERLAQDFFSDDVGRVLAFDGSRVLSAANDTLRATIDEFPSLRVARHAKIALNQPLAQPRRVLNLADTVSSRLMPASELNGKIEYKAADAEKACRELESALTTDSDVAAETLGHIDFKFYADKLSAIVAEESQAAAARIQKSLLEILSARGVAAHVLESIEACRKRYAAAGGSKR